MSVVGEELGESKVVGGGEEAIGTCKGIEVIGFDGIEAFRLAGVDPAIKDGSYRLSVCVSTGVEEVFARPVRIFEQSPAGFMQQQASVCRS